MSPDDFNAAADGFIAALPQFVTEANALADFAVEQVLAIEEDATQTALDRIATGDDTNATTADRVQTGLNRVATGIDRTAVAADKTVATEQAALATTNGAVQVALATTQTNTATAQAQLAAGYAASASSVVQQDLSAVVVQALHKSPNPVTAMCLYDTSKDSDGGAWTEKCQHLSWYNESLNGVCLGARADETAARAVSGATTGDWFQKISDGKFYKLNVTSGTTEVFRGNKAKFPRLAAIIAEAANVTIYDLTEPGRPMWMRFNGVGYFSGFINWSNGSASVSSISMINGLLVIGQSIGANGIQIVSFIKDSIKMAGYTITSSRSILSRNSTDTFVAGGDSYSIVSNAINAIAMTILPDAPVDPSTGLKIPTIAVATAGGISVIQNTGAVNNVVFTGADDVTRVAFTNDNKIYVFKGASTAPVTKSGVMPIPTADVTDGWLETYGSVFSTADVRSGLAYDSWDANRAATIGKGTVFRASYLGLTLIKRDRSFPTKALLADITDTYNTGYMVGDIRRCYLALADGSSGSVGPANELVTNGDFSSGTTGWAVGYITDEGAFSVTSGVARIKRDVATSPLVVTSITTVAGETYKISVGLVTPGGTNSYRSLYWGGSSNGIGGIELTPGGALASGNAFTFVATTTGTTYIVFRISAGDATTYFDFDNVSCKLVIPDRSYKAAGAAIYGTLTKAPVSSGSQLVAYSGFSASNYVREPYSADLDFALAEWSISAWINYTTAVVSTILHRYYDGSTPRIQFGTDASGKLTATVIDAAGSPATITVTTDAAYNVGTWVKARLNYKAGRLSIHVNGIEVKATFAAPLATLTNATATLTIGENAASTAPFPGSITLVKASATVPNAEQALWMYQQEAPLFKAGVNCTLPASTNVLDMSYDEADDSYHVAQATYESEFTGLVRTAANAPSAGSIIKTETKGRVKLLARSTTSPGVDVSIPAYGLRSELVARAEAAAKLAQPGVCFDFTSISFTANGVAGEYQVTSVSATGTPYLGMGFTNAKFSAGVAGTVITGINSTTYQVSTVHASGNQTGGTFLQSDFKLPCGYTAKEVYVAGAKKQEGSTKDWTRLFDGFCETIRFGTGPASASWVQIVAVKEI